MHNMRGVMAMLGYLRVNYESGWELLKYANDSFATDIIDYCSQVLNVIPYTYLH